MTLPKDIEILVTDDSVYLDLLGFIQFLRNHQNVPPEYADEIIHMNKLADYLEKQFSETLLQHRLLAGEFNEECPN